MRVATVFCSALAIGFAVWMADSKDYYLERSRQVMWLHRFHIDEARGWGDASYAEHLHGKRMEAIESVLRDAGGVEPRTIVEASKILTRSCEIHSADIEAFFGKSRLA